MQQKILQLCQGRHCFNCMVHENKLSAEHNKDPAYISEGFKNWKKGPRCFKEHEESKYHKYSAGAKDGTSKSP